MPPPLRLSFACHEFPPYGGGAASALDRFTRVLAARGHAVQLLTVGDGHLPPLQEEGGRTLIRLGSARRTLLAPSAGELLRTYLTLRMGSAPHLRAFAPHLLVAYFAFPGGHALLPTARRLGIPLMVSLRGSDVPGFHNRRFGVLAPLLTRLTRSVLRRADRVVANGVHLQQLAQASMPGLRVDNLPNGIDLPPFPDPFPPPRPPRLLFVGQFIPRKRCLELVEALAWLGEHGHSVHATLVGDGPLRPEVQDRAARLPPGITLELPGHQPREAMGQIYRDHDLLLHLSQAEGLSNVLLEGLAHGLAILATPESCDPLLAESGAIRRVADPTPAALGAALAGLLQHPQELAAMRRAALESARALDWDRVAEAFEALVADGLIPPHPAR